MDMQNNNNFDLTRPLTVNERVAFENNLIQTERNLAARRGPSTNNNQNETHHCDCYVEPGEIKLKQKLLLFVPIIIVGVPGIVLMIYLWCLLLFH